MIFIGQKGTGSSEPTLLTEVESLEPPYPDVLAITRQSGSFLPVTALNGADWALISADTAALVHKLKAAGKPLVLFLQVKDFKPLSRAFLQLLSRTNAYRVAQTHDAYSEATAVCGSKGLVEARRICRYAPFATLSGGNAGT